MWKMGASNFTSFGSQLYGTWRRRAFCCVAQMPQGERTMLEKREERERKIKNTEENVNAASSLDIKLLSREKQSSSKPYKECETDWVQKKDTKETCPRGRCSVAQTRDWGWWVRRVWCTEQTWLAGRGQSSGYPESKGAGQFDFRGKSGWKHTLQLISTSYSPKSENKGIWGSLDPTRVCQRGHSGKGSNSSLCTLPWRNSPHTFDPGSFSTSFQDIIVYLNGERGQTVHFLLISTVMKPDEASI